MTTTEHRWNLHDSWNFEHGSCTCGVRGGMGYLVEHWLKIGRESAKGELVTLDDPRVKPGATARREQDTSGGHQHHIVGTVSATEGLLSIGPYPLSPASRIYLLGEAPDLDAEAVEALAASAQLCDRESRDAIANLRSIGFDIVRKGDPA